MDAFHDDQQPAAPDQQPVTPDQSADAQAPAPVSKKVRRFFAKLRELLLFRLRISIKLRPGAKPEERVDSDKAPEPEAALKPETSPPKPDKQEPPREKEEKPKKPKKEKPAKSKKRKGGKKPPLLLLAAGGVVLCGIVAALFLILGPKQTVEDRLARARLLVTEGQYEKASQEFSHLLDQDSTLIEAYLGMADISVALDDVDSAINTLKAGYTATLDPRLFERLQELQPAEELAGLREQVSAQLPDEPVTWKDPAFENMVRQALKKPGTQPIMKSELRAVTTLKILGGTHASVQNDLQSSNRRESYTVDGTVYDQRGSILSLDDLENFPNLKRLTVGYNQVADISGVKYCTSLQSLGLYCNDIEELAALSDLKNLQWLYLYSNRIVSLEPLSALTGLQELWLQDNQIAGLQPLAGLTALTELFVGNNQITDISPVASLSKLVFFYAENNQITNISAVAELKELSDVNFLQNPVADLSPAAHVPKVNDPIVG